MAEFLELGPEDKPVFTTLGGFRLYNKAKQVFSFGGWKGNVSLSVFGDSKLLLAQPLSIFAIAEMAKALRKVQASGGPVSSEPIPFKKWDENTKGFRVVTKLIIAKNDERVVVISISNETSGNLQFEVISPTSLGDGNKAARSETGVNAMLLALENACVTAMVMSKRKFIPPAGGFGSSGSNNHSGITESDIKF